MKANSIEDALNLFDPHQPLLEEDDIKAYYVARDNSPIEEIKTILKTATYFPKLLFSGPPGCGKSTELAKLQEMLKKDFHVVMFSVKEITNTFRISSYSMLFHILKKIADKAKEAKLSIYSEKLEKVTHGGIAGDTDIELLSAEKNEKSDIDDIVSDDTKQDGIDYGIMLESVLRRPSKPGADAVLDLINDTVWDLEEKTEKDVLVLVTDIDKLDLDNAYYLLTRSSLYLNKIHCFAVYTFPLELKFKNDLIDLYRNFDGIYFLPNFHIYDRYGKLDKNCEQKLREIITKRMPMKLIYDEAINQIVQFSGGIVFELINLVRQCCIVSLLEKINFIDDEIVREAVERIRRFYRSFYSDKELKLLSQIKMNKRFISSNASFKLMRQFSFAEYGTWDEVWYDVNPILTPLLVNIELDKE